MDGKTSGKRKSIQGKISFAFWFLSGCILFSTAVGVFALAKILTESNPEDIRAIARILIGVLILVFLFSSVLAVLLRKRIMRTVADPLKQVNKAAKLFSVGFVDTQINYSSADEIGETAAYLNEAFSHLKRMVGQIADLLTQMSEGNYTAEKIAAYQNDFKPISDALNLILERQNRAMDVFLQSSQQVDASAQQVSTAAQQLAQGATEQASSTEELAASITDISQKINESSKGASEASHYLDETSENVKQSDDQMRQLLSAMDEINQASDEISKIIKAIDDIAFQTNILALNAAVEASRAGEAGRGFAVVADEVRTLAGKTAEESKRTADLIEGTITKIHEGRTLALGTAKGLDSVSEHVGRLDETIRQITEAFTAQAGAVQQVQQGVEQISSVVQSNSATAEESAAASEELAGQADVLQKELAHFRLRRQTAAV